ncbi:glucan endo-1,3-beta-glucosidase GV isoform X2 [Physcomitrium patens]|uniref:glucan endo-1,3-beta-glucosidase GV isoform X2 n=1 Tax=Physcomitrium patens TaxID=3218 RepID=UPI000D151FD3|nr:probable glucan endo-1,3-beta-glucosidase A6 isoform X2 [Physcomitrium patens]|eukprot:XP_024371108.1 probable glucan endo-1,3-beta-glucosidase A6 isoform X2 [Physcomitrella patens]
MSPPLLLSLCLTLLTCQCHGQAPLNDGYAQQSRTLGINYGTLGDNLPSPADAVAAIKAMKIGRVKLFSPNADILTALANTGMEVVVAVPNEEIVAVGASPAAATAWVRLHISPYHPEANIVVILVGNEIFTGTTFQSTWTSLLPATQNLHAAIESFGWSGQIRISTAVALDVLASSFPPSAGTFRSDIATSFVRPLLSFLTKTNSYLFVNVYPFLTYSSSSDINLSYAMFASTTDNVVDGGLTYTNLMDAQLDAVYAAATKLGFTSLRIAIGETGWPSAGDSTEVAATIDNAANYNRRLVRKILSTTQIGTPARPGVFIPTYIFALFNENLKPGVSSERNWGLLHPNLSPVYAIDLTGQIYDSQYSPNSNSSPLQTGSGTWCISNENSDPVTLENGLNFACGADVEFCKAIQPSASCYLPSTIVSHAAWAFNNYWQKYKGAGGSCSFSGAGVLTSTDPSKSLSSTSEFFLSFSKMNLVCRCGRL